MYLAHHELESILINTIIIIAIIIIIIIFFITVVDIAMVVIVIVVDGYTNILIIIIISGAGLTWVPNWTSGRKRSMLSKTSPLPCQIRWKPSQRTVTIAASQQAVVLGYCSLPTCTGRSVIQSSGHSSLCTLQHRLPIDSVVQHMSSPRVRYIQSCKI